MALATIEFKIKVAWWHKLLLPIWAVQLYFGKEIWIPSSMIKMDTAK